MSTRITVDGVPTARIARLTESDWEQFAELRLRALTDTFGTSDKQYLTEVGFTPADWRRRLRDHAQFVVVVADRPVYEGVGFTEVPTGGAAGEVVMRLTLR